MSAVDKASSVKVVVVTSSIAAVIPQFHDNDRSP